jgi:hypothetical protein
MSPDAALQLGIDARRHGLEATDNYWHTDQQPMHDAWLRGWQMADDQDDVELPEEEAV